MADDVIALETVSARSRGGGAARPRRAPSAGCGRSARSPTTARSPPRTTPSWWPRSTSSSWGPTERIPEDWFAKQVAFADRTDGDIDTLANRIAHIRTWTFVSNRADWLDDPEHWQARTRAIEDSLSDALHERLTQRFIDRRTSALMRGLQGQGRADAEIADDGAVQVEKHTSAA